MSRIRLFILRVKSYWLRRRVAKERDIFERHLARMLTVSNLTARINGQVTQIFNPIARFSVNKTEILTDADIMLGDKVLRTTKLGNGPVYVSSGDRLEITFKLGDMVGGAEA